MALRNGDSLLREIVTLSDLASLCVCSERSVQRLVKAGVLKLARDKNRRIMKARFVLGEAMPAFCEHLRDTISSNDPNEATYAAARARRMQASAESQEMDLQLKRGELIEVSRVTSEVTSLLLTVRNHLLAIPSRVTRQLLPHVAAESGNANFQKAYETVNGEVRQALREASEFDMKQLVNAADRERNGKSASRDDDD